MCDKGNLKPTVKAGGNNQNWSPFLAFLWLKSKKGKQISPKHGMILEFKEIKAYVLKRKGVQKALIKVNFPIYHPPTSISGGQARPPINTIGLLVGGW